MIKKFEKVVVLFLSIWLVFGSVSVYAYDPDRVFDGTDVGSWTQGSWDECDSFIIGDGRTIQRAGCGYFATSYALVKAGVMDVSSGRAPIDFIMQVVNDGNTDTSWGHFKMTTINQYYPEVTCEEYMYGLMNSGMSLEEALVRVKDFYNQGKFVIIDVSAPGITDGHYLFVDGYKDDGTMIIGDSGKPYTDLQPYLDAGLTIKYCTVYSIEGKNCNELASIYSNEIGSETDPNGEMTEEEVALNNAVVKEYDLEGMGKYKNYLSPADLQEPIIYPDGMNLSVAEQYNVSRMRENIESKSLTPASFFHALSVFIGICCILYGVLLLLAYLTDYNNTFVEFSLLKLISFGKFRVLEQEDERLGIIEPGYDKNRHITYLSVPMIIKRIVLLIIIGLLLISGAVGGLLMAIIFFFQDHVF